MNKVFFCCGIFLQNLAEGSMKLEILYKEVGAWVIQDGFLPIIHNRFTIDTDQL